MIAKIGNRRRGVRRRGIAALLVFLLLSVTLALSYAAMRSQSMTVMIHQNARRRPAAQQAAITGMTLAIKQMNLSSWAGVGTTYSASLGPYESFQVTYTTGDPSLTSSSTGYSDYPWRVTLLATGYSADPDNPQNLATYQIQAVVHLVPKALATEPSGWSNMLPYTIYQTQWNNFDVVVPSQVQGPVYIQGYAQMSRDIWPGNDTIRQRYFADLSPLKTAKGLDDRPYTGTVTITNFWQYSDTLTILSELGLSTVNLGWPQWSSWDPVANATTYRLYPGGQRYTSQTVSNSLQNATFQSDPIANPLGIFYSAGQVTVSNNVIFQGTLMSAGDVIVQGVGTQFNPVTLPTLYGSTTVNQLPVVAGEGNFYVNAGANVAVNGQVTVANLFEVVAASQSSTVMSFLGQVIAGSVYVQGRTEWLSQTSAWWTSTYNTFMAQVGKNGGSSYFPYYLQKHTTLNPTPQLIIKPSASPVRYHWQSWRNSQNTENPVFVPATGDPGLYWDIYSWTPLS